MLKYPFNKDNVVYTKSHLISDHAMSLNHIMVIIALLCVRDYFHYAMWITNENNRRIIGMLGRIIGEISRIAE